MEPTIQTLPKKLLLGNSLSMSIANNRTSELWASFAPRIKEVPNKIGNDRYSLQVYPTGYFDQFNPAAEFKKHALVELPKDYKGVVPDGMERFELKEGLYAVFHYVGSSADPSIYNYIYSEWLPKSKYQLDDRPHFEILGEKYKNNNPHSEEDIWIPIKEK